jgi:hypothetical protein
LDPDAAITRRTVRSSNAMRRTSLATALVLGCALGASAIAAQQVASKSVPGDVAMGAIPALADEALAMHVQDAAAAAVIAALRAQFQQRDVELRIDHLHGEELSLRDLQLAGQGRIRIEGSQAWLPVRFQALYDTATATVLSPAVTLDRTSASLASAADLPTDSLDRVVTGQLAAEFVSQQVDFDLAAVRVTGGDARYALVEGGGVATFAGEGEAPVRLQAVFDREQQAWVRVDYRMEGESFDDVPTAIVAQR